MKYERRNLIFLKFCDSNYSYPGLCSKPTDKIVDFAKNLKLLVLENTDNSKPPNSLVMKDDPARIAITITNLRVQSLSTLSTDCNMQFSPSSKE